MSILVALLSIILVLAVTVYGQNAELESIVITVDHNLNGEFTSRGRFNVPLKAGGKLVSGLP
jgi:hypothetical protein